MVTKIHATRHLVAVAITIVLFFAGCSENSKAKASAALKASEEAFNAVKDDAAKYAPEQAQKIKDALAKAKADIEKTDYPAALVAAKEISAKAQQLRSAALQAQEELDRQWTEVNRDVPKLMDQVEARAKRLESLHKLPPKASLKLAAAKKEWANSTAALKAGNLREALAKAKIVQADLWEAAEAVGLNVKESVK